MIKALFFDIDGTLVSFTTHQIPQSTIDALRRAHASGVKIIISTGRPMSIINSIGAIKDLVDGYITMNGACTIVNGKVISSLPISPDDVKTVLEVSDRFDVSCIVVGPTQLALYNPQQSAVDIFDKLLAVPGLGQGVSVEETLKGDVFQLTPFIDEDEEHEALPLLKDVEVARWYPAFCDITRKGVSKAKGMEAIARYFGFDLKDTMGFGDGGNDIPMIQAAGIGVAMGNANDSLKAVADYVTTSVDEDGVANALAKFL